MTIEEGMVMLYQNVRNKISTHSPEEQISHPWCCKVLKTLVLVVIVAVVLLVIVIVIVILTDMNTTCYADYEI
jgi:hypothetical protein